MDSQSSTQSKKWDEYPEHSYERYAANVRQTNKGLDPLDEDRWRKLPIKGMSRHMIDNKLYHNIRSIMPDGSRTLAYAIINQHATELSAAINKLGKLSPMAQRRSDFLDQVRAMVTKDRSSTHGDAEDNFADIAALLNITLKKHLAKPLDPLDVAKIMICVKLSRMISSPENIDHWHDTAGYAACGGGIIESKKQQPK